MPESFHLADPGDLGGLALGRLISRLGVSISASATFVWNGEGDLSEAWDHWLTGPFRAALAPAFVQAHRFAGENRVLELVTIDRELDRNLPEPLHAGSLAAGKSFLSGKEGMQANREWSRFAAQVTDGKSPGHVPVLFALHASLYHLPLLPALAAYTWFELESGLPRGGWKDRPGSRELALEAFAGALPELQVAVLADRGDFGDTGPRLRAI